MNRSLSLAHCSEPDLLQTSISVAESPAHAPRGRVPLFARRPTTLSDARRSCFASPSPHAARVERARPRLSCLVRCSSHPLGRPVDPRPATTKGRGRDQPGATQTSVAPRTQAAPRRARAPAPALGGARRERRSIIRPRALSAREPWTLALRAGPGVPLCAASRRAPVRTERARPLQKRRQRLPRKAPACVCVCVSVESREPRTNDPPRSSPSPPPLHRHA
jgi:hypothetical protein